MFFLVNPLKGTKFALVKTFADLEGRTKCGNAFYSKRI